MAQITGYKIQHRLRELAHERDLASHLFDNGKFRFEGENKPSCEEAFARFEEAESALARLQTAQAKYNLAVTVDVQGVKMTLAEAVKRVGGAGRMEKMWRSIAAPKDRYGYGNPSERATDVERAEATISTEQAAYRAQKASRYASALREAIQVGNATLVDVSGLDPGLFE